MQLVVIDHWQVKDELEIVTRVTSYTSHGKFQVFAATNLAMSTLRYLVFPTALVNLK